MNNSSPNEKALFAAARELTDTAQRQAFLDQACTSDPQMRQRLEEMLTSQTEAEQFFVQGTIELAFPSTINVAVTEKPGDRIGRYKLLERIGEGGCGVVYVAEQEEPVRRRVALKLIKLGMDTRSVIARFEAERQALAMMDHPNIAKVLDAGATDTGRPYFVMELVRGIKLTEYCDQNKLPTAERLDLFIKVCQAVQHAHQKGIIHRDIKPSNILATVNDGEAVPKVIDFGIAKATEGRLTDKTVYTELHQFIGTPAYMSPEQAEMTSLDIDTRSDIYSLGVLLYELLTGCTPFDTKELLASGLDAMRRTIRDKDPLRPSNRLNTLSGEQLTTTADRRGVDAPKLMHMLRGDLDWIVMRCLEKDRTRRYETATGLAADLTRHVKNEPVVARPPSASYRFQKAIRRNRLPFAAACAIVLALLLGTGLSLWQALRAKRAQALALQTRGDAEKLSNFLLDDLYAELEPTGQFDTVGRLAKQALAYYDNLPPSLRTLDTDRNRAIAQARLSVILARQGDPKAALLIAEHAATTLSHLNTQGDESEATVFSLALARLAQSGCYQLQGDLKSGVASLQQGIQIITPLATSTKASRRVKLEYANLLNQLAHFQPPAQGIDLCEQARTILAGLGALDLSDLSAASSWANIADSEARAAFMLGRMDLAEQLEQQAQKLAEGVVARRPGDLSARLDSEHAPDLLVCIEASRFHEVEALRYATNGIQAGENYVRMNPSDEDGWVSLGRLNYSVAALLFRQGHVAEGLSQTRTAIDTEQERRHTGGNIGNTAYLWSVVARWEAQRGHRGAADQAIQEARTWFETFGSRLAVPELTKDFRAELFGDYKRWVKLASGEDTEVCSMARSALARIEQLKTKLGDKSSPMTRSCFRVHRRTLEQLARAALNLGRYKDAETTARALISLRPDDEVQDGQNFLDQPADFVFGQVLLSQAVCAQGRNAEALRLVQPALQTYHEEAAQGASHLTFRQHFIRALCVQSMAEPEDDEGSIRRHDELEQAGKLLQSLTDEARQLHDSNELLSLIGVAQLKLNAR